MSADEAIQTIASLYPPDSQYGDTAAKGRELLKQAKDNTHYSDDWRDLPKPVLVEFARLCEAEENRQYREHMKRSF